MKKIELKVGDIWGVPPLEKTLDIRIIWGVSYGMVYFWDIGCQAKMIAESFFKSRITRKKAVLIGYYDFKTEKAMTVKGEKR